MLAVSVHAWFSNDEVSLAPGSTGTLVLTVHNLSNDTASCTILPAGLTATWTAISQGNVTLFGGSQETVEIEVTPPEMPSTTAGPTTIAVRVIPLDDADDAIVAESTLMVEAFDDVRLVPLQPIQRARHRAGFEFMAENHGNTVASCRLHLVDPSDRVDGDFDPPAVGVAPGSAHLVLLKARARRGGWRRQTRILDFDVEAVQQGTAPVTASMSFVQSPTVARGTVARLAALVALVGAVVASWLLVVEPAIEDAAADQVDLLVAGLDTANTDNEVLDPSAPTSEPSTQPAPDIGEPTFFRLQVDAPLTQTADQTITMPDGLTFDMTDVLIENPFNDRGVARLLVNGDTLFVWSLENVRGNYFVPNITPIRLSPGDNVAFSVRCDEIGDTSRSTCTNAVNLGGESRPVDAG